MCDGRRLAVIERQAVDDLLKAWQSSAGTVLSCETLHNKDTVWLITMTRGEQLVLKEVGARSEARRLASYYPVWLHLATCGIPVAVPFLSDDGSCFVTYRDTLYTLSPYLPAVTRVAEKHGFAHAHLYNALTPIRQSLSRPH